MVKLKKRFVSLIVVLALLFSAVVGVRVESVHDVAVVDISSKSKFLVNYNQLIIVFPAVYWVVYINVTVENQGDFYENFTVTIYYENATTQMYVGAKNVINLAPGTNMTLAFTWWTKGVTPCTYNYTANKYIPYTLSANASVVEGETETEDNVYGGVPVVVRIPGDANGNGHVEVGDLALLGANWYTQCYPSILYDWRADFNGDGCVKVGDLAIVGAFWYKY